MNSIIAYLKLVSISALMLIFFSCSKKDDPTLQQEQPGSFEMIVTGKLDAELSGDASFEQVIVKGTQPGAGGATLSILLEAGKDYSLNIVLKKTEPQAFGINNYIYSAENEIIRISMVFIDYEEAKTSEIYSGNIEITKGGDELIVGTFSGELNDDTDGIIIVNGNFRAKGATSYYAK